MPVYRNGKTWPLAQQLAAMSKVNVQISSGAGGSTLLAANYNRKYLRMTNIDGAAYVYLSFGGSSTPVANTGIRLGPGESFEMIREYIFTGAVKAISTVNNSLVSATEGTG